MQTKGNAKRTLENNFIKDEDYKVVILRTENNLNIKDLGGRPDENIMFNGYYYKYLEERLVL